MSINNKFLPHPLPFSSSYSYARQGRKGMHLRIYLLLCAQDPEIKRDQFDIV